MDTPSIAHEQLDVVDLQALRVKLFNELRALEALPQHELRREYYRIKPRLRDLYRELAEIHGT